MHIPHVCKCPQRLGEDIGSPGAGVTGSREPPDMGAGNGAQVLHRAVYTFKY